MSVEYIGSKHELNAHDLLNIYFSHSNQHPEWISNLQTTNQSKFFFVPLARKAGLKTGVSVAMVYKSSIIAVLSWYNIEVNIYKMIYT